MNIVFYILHKFFQEESFYTIAMIICSFIMNIFQTNIISYITATIIESIHNFNVKNIHLYFNIFVIISILYVILLNLYKFFQTKILTRLRQWVRLQLITALLQVNNNELQEINFTKLNSPINRVSSVVFMATNDIITYILPNITFLFIICFYFLYQNPTLGIGFIFGNMCILGYLLFNWKEILEYNKQYENMVGETETALQEILSNIDKIIYRGQTGNEIERFEKQTNKSIGSAYTFYSNSNYHIMNMIYMVYFIMCLSIWFIIKNILNKQMSVTIFITIFTIIVLYREKLLTVIQQIPDIIEFIGRTESVIDKIKNIEQSFFKLNTDVVLMKPEFQFNTIQFKDVSFKYKSSNTYIFDKFNITLNISNKIIGITGLSGNGKSTFVKLLLKMYKCDNGEIYIDKYNINTVDPDYLRQHITYVNQNSKLFDITVNENMLYGCIDTDKCDEYLQQIMKSKQIQELYKKMNIYKTEAGYLGENLSGGQRQIVNIIGGLINPTQILILDEPTNALDPNLKREILGIIKLFKKYKKCIIIITHDKDVYPLFDENVQL